MSSLPYFMAQNAGVSASSPGAGLARATGSAGRRGKDAKRRAPIPQRHANHHIIRRDAWGRGSWRVAKEDMEKIEAVHNGCLRKICQIFCLQ